MIQVGQIGDNLIARLLASDVPTVVAGRPLNHPNASYVDVDNIAGSHTAVTHLLHLGHKRIAMITGDMRTTAALDRYTGYCKILQEHDLPVDQTLISEGYFTEIGGYEAMQRLLPYKPDAVFSASDAMALGALKAIDEAGLSVPHDIALVSFDDLAPATIAKPQLTTVHQPVHAFGVKAVEMLIDVIKNGLTPPRRVIMETELVIRESCGSS